jgi:hypothetical protein
VSRPALVQLGAGGPFPGLKRKRILYGSETWTITGKMASTLMTWEREILRKIYGPKSEQDAWRIRSNLEIQNMYKSPDIVTEIKVRRMEC